ncbi:HU family DNA-binding protein [Noviherbaspirillum pedocola]|uniref:HU family DNA-binding protein n=1 Tax=Noviherbaspirillum pedocola TaxID=2801341 RepID=A0A934SUX5_9BURK|nr:HU family DNA-binding protein [Noviherbaspirillum pedocola]MBK4735890.1 HU family DNA-binding protein [Noviherbaspirillum pedocola]
MKKSELIEALAVSAQVTKPQARVMLDRLIEVIQTGVKKEGRFLLSGIGTFSVIKRGARTGRNPNTGAAVKIKAKKSVKFRSSPDLKDAAAKSKV